MMKVIKISVVLLAALFFFMLFSLTHVFAANKSCVERFADPCMAKAVAEVLSIDERTPVSDKMLKSVTELDVTGKRIKNMAGLNQLKHLKKLKCARNSIQYLPELGELKQLRELDCSFNRIFSLDGVGKLEKLTTLSIYNNQLEQLPSLKKLKSLVAFHCDDNNLQKLDGIEKLQKLERLSCSGNRITELPIQKLKKLQVIKCSDNQLQELDTSHNRDLKALEFAYNQISKIDFRKNPKLGIVIGDNNQISDFSSLKHTNFAVSPESFLNHIKNQSFTRAELQILGRVEHTIPQGELLDEYGRTMSIVNISRNGYYNAKTRTIIWKNVPEDEEVELSFQFVSSNQKISGKVDISCIRTWD